MSDGRPAPAANPVKRPEKTAQQPGDGATDIKN